MVSRLLWHLVFARDHAEGQEGTSCPSCGFESLFGSPAKRWRRPDGSREGAERRAAGCGRTGDPDLQSAYGGLAASVTVGRKKDPAGHQRKAGEDPKGLVLPRWSVNSQYTTLSRRMVTGRVSDSPLTVTFTMEMVASCITYALPSLHLL
jgi:hypothetical protein